MTSLTAIGAMVFTAFSLHATRDQLEAARAQTAVAAQGQFTERYAKAVEMLDQAGDDHVQVRLGAIYSLERLARDSPRDSATIVAVLSAFIRTSTSSTIHGEPCVVDFVSVDVQTALTVLGRGWPNAGKGPRADLRGACLPHSYLENADLRYADLRFTQLRGSNLESADLSHTHLDGANLAHANLAKAVFSDTNATDTIFTTAIFDGATLRRVNFENADLTAATHDNHTTIEAPRTNSTTRGQWW